MHKKYMPGTRYGVLHDEHTYHFSSLLFFCLSEERRSLDLSQTFAQTDLISSSDERDTIVNESSRFVDTFGGDNK